MIRCITIDDEPLALVQLTGYIEKVPFLKLVKACNSALEALNLLAKDPVDLIFADINMPDLNGIDFVKSLVNKPIIIFTTAYTEYAIEGFRVNALDYLLKPFGYNEFLKAANKAQRTPPPQTTSSYASAAPQLFPRIRRPTKTPQSRQRGSIPPNIYNS